jgi:AcrR family transcriptional regulator
MKHSISARQTQIIEATGKVLMQKGIKGLTTKNLALQMGFTEGALYRHFKSKDDIIALLLNYFSTNISERITPILETTESAENQLKMVFKSQFNFLSQHPHFVIAILSEGLFDESEKINRAILLVFETKMDLLSRIINSGKINQEFTLQLETKEIIHLLAGSFRLLILKWKFSKFEFDLPAEGNQLMKSIIDLIKYKS